MVEKEDQQSQYLREVRKALELDDSEAAKNIVKEQKALALSKGVNLPFDVVIIAIDYREKIIQWNSLIAEKLNFLLNNEDVRYCEYDKLFLHQRFFTYLFFKDLGIHSGANPDKDIEPNDDGKEFLAMIDDHQKMLGMLEGEADLLPNLRKMSPFKLKNTVHNRYFKTEESKMRQAVSAFEDLLITISEFKNTSKKDIIEITNLIFNRKLTKLGHFLFDGILNDFEIQNKKDDKSQKMRLLFPLFQITHPGRCVDEEVWEKTRGKKDILQDYKSYQVSTIKSIIGEK